VAASLLEFTDPETGARPIRAVRRKEEVLDGPYLDRAPDLLQEAAPLYSLTHARRMVEEADWLSGDHRPEGIYAAAGPGAATADGSEVSLADFAAMIEAAVGLEGEREEAPAEAGADVFSEDEEREVEERLRGLGYLE
jgi:hypothetical protein